MTILRVPTFIKNVSFIELKAEKKLSCRPLRRFKFLQTQKRNICFLNCAETTSIKYEPLPHRNKKGRGFPSFPFAFQSRSAVLRAPFGRTAEGLVGGWEQASESSRLQHLQGR